MEKEEDSKKDKKKALLKKILKILIILIIIFLASWWAAYSKTRKAHKKDNALYDELEKMYSEGNYSEMTDYYYQWSDKLEGRKYAKFKRVAELYDEYEAADGYMREAYSKYVEGEEAKADYAWEMEQLFRIILLCDVYREEGYPYDEEKAVTDIRDMVVNYLQGVLLLDKLQIEKTASKYLEADDTEEVDAVKVTIDRLAVESMSKVLD